MAALYELQVWLCQEPLQAQQVSYDALNSWVMSRMDRRCPECYSCRAAMRWVRASTGLKSLADKPWDSWHPVRWARMGRGKDRGHACMRRVASLSLSDQILANASNAVMVLAVIGSSTPEEVGVFTVAYLVLAFLAAIMRSFLAAKISISSADPSECRREARRSLGILLISFPLPILLVLAASWIASPGFLGVGGLVALASPLVLIQDLQRYAAVALGRVIEAAWSDLLWLVLGCAALYASLNGRIGADIVVWIWVFGALLSGLLLAIRLQLTPEFSGLMAWLRESGSYRAHLTLSSLAMGASVPLALVIYSRLGGTSAVAAVGVLGQLMAPVNTVTAFVGLTALAALSGRDYRSKVIMIRRYGFVLVGLALVWSWILMLVPQSWGETVLGPTWNLAQPLILLAGLQYALGGIAQVATILLTSTFRSSAVLVGGTLLAIARLCLVTFAAFLSDQALSLVLAETGAMLAWASISTSMAARERGRYGDG